jgi:hypothetical protein
MGWESGSGDRAAEYALYAEEKSPRLYASVPFCRCEADIDNAEGGAGGTLRGGTFGRRAGVGVGIEGFEIGAVASCPNGLRDRIGSDAPVGPADPRLGTEPPMSRSGSGSAGLGLVCTFAFFRRAGLI